MNTSCELNPFQFRTPSYTSVAIYWGLNGFVAFFCLILAFASTRLVQSFASLFGGLGVELPWPTRFLFATYFWILPLYFAGLAVLLFTKDLWPKDFHLKRLITVRIFLAALVMTGVVVFILYLPLLTVASKLLDSK